MQNDELEIILELIQELQEKVKDTILILNELKETNKNQHYEK